MYVRVTMRLAFFPFSSFVLASQKKPATLFKTTADCGNMADWPFGVLENPELQKLCMHVCNRWKVLRPNPDQSLSAVPAWVTRLNVIQFRTLLSLEALLSMDSLSDRYLRK
jgi:hypothetical protein